ncbi:hypothetical protein [Spirillospora sp. CA-128828]|uniref:hypothetical protein n=1 Tax=Spirillospora sp. CA-128828 TaxID=3240033 RepID=UPI003D8F80A6
MAKWVAHRRLLADPGSVGEAASPRRLSWRGRWFAVAGVVVVAVAGTVWAVAQGADAGCQQVSGSIEDSRTRRTWDHLFQCPNRPRVAVYEKAGFGTEVAVLETDPSWFICWTRGQRHSGGNDVWYYTQGDRSTGMPELDGWGYVPASDLRVGDAPDPGLTRHC